MQRKMILLAAIAFCGVASAQSSVTLFGVVDLAYESVKTNAGRISGIAPSGSETTSRFGVRGVEDLGGGLAAGFHLESSLNPSTGSSSSGIQATNQETTLPAGPLAFSRRSTVSLFGGRGEVRIGRDLTASYRNYLTYDPVMAGNGVGGGLVESTAAPAAAYRVSNSIAYFLPDNLGGIYGQAMYALGDRASNETFTGTTPSYAVGQNTSNNGRYAGIRLGYAQGPIDTAVAYGRLTYAPGTFSTSTMGLPSFAFGNFTDINWGGSYKFGQLTVMGMITRQTFDDADALGNKVKNKAWVVGGQWAVGAGTVQLAYSRLSLSGLLSSAPKASKWGAAYEHNLSKRTALYAAYGHVTNSGGAAQAAASGSSGALRAVAGAVNVNGNSSGIDLGIRHSF